jgi:hypothetical protein
MYDVDRTGGTLTRIAAFEAHNEIAATPLRGRLRVLSIPAIANLSA